MSQADLRRARTIWRIAQALACYRRRQPAPPVTLAKLRFLEV